MSPGRSIGPNSKGFFLSRSCDKRNSPEVDASPDWQSNWETADGEKTKNISIPFRCGTTDRETEDPPMICMKYIKY